MSVSCDRTVSSGLRQVITQSFGQLAWLERGVVLVNGFTDVLLQVVICNLTQVTEELGVGDQHDPTTLVIVESFGQRLAQLAGEVIMAGLFASVRLRSGVACMMGVAVLGGSELTDQLEYVGADLDFKDPRSAGIGDENPNRKMWLHERLLTGQNMRGQSA